MKNNREYQICKELAKYLNLQYPKVQYRFDMAGLNLSMVQATMNKQIQKGAGWPDLFIASNKIGHTKIYYGLFIEVKKEGTKLTTKLGLPASPHLNDQYLKLIELRKAGYMAEFGIGIDDCINIIDTYLK